MVYMVKELLKGMHDYWWFFFLKYALNQWKCNYMKFNIVNFFPLTMARSQSPVLVLALT